MVSRFANSGSDKAAYKNAALTRATKSSVNKPTLAYEMSLPASRNRAFSKDRNIFFLREKKS